MKYLMLSLVVVVIVAVMGAGWVISEVYYRVSNDDNYEGDLKAYKQLGKNIAFALDDLSDRKEFVASWQQQGSVMIILQDKSNFLIPKNLKENFLKGMPLLLDSEDEVTLHVYMKKSNQVMTMLLPDQNESQKKSWIGIVFTLSFYFIVVILLLVWLYPLIKRLLVLRESTYRFGQGDLSSRITPSKISYIADIENEFNRMADCVQKLIDDNKLLSRAVSHDLKTPLTRLQFGIDVLEEAETEGARKKYIHRINKDIHEMQSLVEALLQYASLDEFSIQLKPENINLNAFVAELCEQSDVAINTRFSDESVTLNIDPRYLSMLLNNIIINALRHAKSMINVSVVTNRHYCENVCILIEDDGEGISVSDRDNVIKPFWRGDYDAKTKGHGMGLAIVARVAVWLDAKLVISESKELGGASIALFFTRS